MEQDGRPDYSGLGWVGLVVHKHNEGMMILFFFSAHREEEEAFKLGTLEGRGQSKSQNRYQGVSVLCFLC